MWKWWGHSMDMMNDGLCSSEGEKLSKTAVEVRVVGRGGKEFQGLWESCLKHPFCTPETYLEAEHTLTQKFSHWWGLQCILYVQHHAYVWKLTWHATGKFTQTCISQCEKGFRNVHIRKINANAERNNSTHNPLRTKDVIAVSYTHLTLPTKA